MNELPSRTNGFSISEMPPTGRTMKEALQIIDALNPEACGRYSWNKLRHLLSRLIGKQHFPAFMDTPRQPMVRGRSVTVRGPGTYALPTGGLLLTSTSELGPKPASISSTYGRCHLPGSPVFYASFNEATVLAEIKPQVDDIVYFMTCVPKPDVTFHSCVVGELDYIRRHGRASIFSNEGFVESVHSWLTQIKSENDYVRLVTDAFLAKLLSRDAHSQEDYNPTSALCGLLLALKCDSPGKGEAIYYPSVAHQGGMNIALTESCFHEKVLITSCKAVQVLNNFGMGIFKTRTIATSSEIAPDGRITWFGTGAEIEQRIAL